MSIRAVGPWVIEFRNAVNPNQLMGYLGPENCTPRESARIDEAITFADPFLARHWLANNPIPRTRNLVPFVVELAVGYESEAMMEFLFKDEVQEARRIGQEVQDALKSS